MKALLEQRRSLVEELRTLHAQAGERVETAALLRMREIREEIEVMDAALSTTDLLTPPATPAASPLLADGGAAPRLRTMRSIDGREHQIFGRGDKLADHANRAQDGMSLELFGNALAAMAAGEAHRFRDEVRALGEGSNTSGGVMVSEELSAQLVDLARAQSVVFRAGATVVPMASNVLRLVRVTADPTVYEPGENVAITESAPTFDAINLQARKLGCLVSASNELLADGANAGQAIIDVMAATMAGAVDNFVLTEVLANSEIGTESSVGAIAYTDLLAGRLAVRLLNGDPTSIIANPNLRYDLSLLTEATTNAYLAPPKELDDLQWFETTRMSEATALIGDPTKIIVGMRKNLELRMSAEAGDAFAKDSTFFRVITRLDASVTRPHFRILAGIS